jgi:small subunit ribosomal protein S14
MATTAKIAKETKAPKYKIRLRNRCRLCGRPRGYLRKFALCCLCFRKLAATGAGVGPRRKVKYDRSHR